MRHVFGSESPAMKYQTVESILSDISSRDCSEIKGVVCTDYAYWTREVLGCGQVFGFFDFANPGTETGKFNGGHDFLVIDGRFIVDLWLREVPNWTKQIVFDLESADDAASVAKYFGDRKRWTLVSR